MEEHLAVVAAGLGEGCRMGKKDCVLLRGAEGGNTSVLPPLFPGEGSLLKRDWGQWLALKLNLLGTREP